MGRGGYIFALCLLGLDYYGEEATKCTLCRLDASTDKRYALRLTVFTSLRRFASLALAVALSRYPPASSLL